MVCGDRVSIPFVGLAFHRSRSARTASANRPVGMNINISIRLHPPHSLGFLLDQFREELEQVMAWVGGLDSPRLLVQSQDDSTRSVVPTEYISTRHRLPLSLGRALLVAEDAWGLLKSHHPELPDAVIRIGTQDQYMKKGHWSPSRWRIQGQDLGEVMIAGEHFHRGGEAITATLIHESAHSLGTYRGIKNCIGGTYHTQAFVELAHEVGLHVYEPSKKYGFGHTSLTASTRSIFSSHIRELDRLLTGFRLSKGRHTMRGREVR